MQIANFKFQIEKGKKHEFFFPDFQSAIRTPQSEIWTPIPGKVIWITPQGAAGNRKAGIGVHFADTPDGAHARTVIESHLAAMMKSNLSTHTM